MSWSLHVMPLHIAAADGGLDWAASASFSVGLPDEPPVARALPTVAGVLTAFREAQCHGSSWFEVAGYDLSDDLPACPDPAICASIGGLDLGEVTLGVDGDGEAGLDGAVTHLGFRKPSGNAVLVAVLALVPRAGPLLVTDDSCDRVIVVSPEDDPTQLAARWPW